MEFYAILARIDANSGFVRRANLIDRRACLGYGIRILGGLGVLSLVETRAHAAGQPIRVAAASDLKFVLALLIDEFQKQSGYRVAVSFGSSGNFAQQIRQGLPVELFLSADEGWVDQLADAGLTRSLLRAGQQTPDRGALYGQGRIALYVPQGSSLGLDDRLEGLKAGWGSIRKFAIANPEHAPYGRAARQALEALGLWEMVRPKLVLGENIAQATQFVATGAAQAGITALSLALAPEVAKQGRHVVLPAHLHAPLRQRMVLTRYATAAAAALYDYLQGAAARELFSRYGFAA